MKATSHSAVSWVLVLTSASSLISMMGLLQIDRIVNQDLYRYGLEFSYQWAMPYWTITKTVFALGWFNIIAAIAFQLYVAIFRGKEKSLISHVEKEVLKAETRPTEKVEIQKEQMPKPTETVDKEPKETAEPITEKEAQEKKEETQTVIEVTSGQGQTESKQSEQGEEQKEQVSEPQRESETEQEKTKPEPQEKSEETPIPAEVPKEEPQPAIEETPQQAGNSVL